ncbi:efflux RND transporter permease subunit [Colwelliaceae bacterium 6471]
MSNSTKQNSEHHDKDTVGATLASFALRRPVTTIMVFLSLFLLGLISSRLLPLEKFPGIDIPALFIQVPYPNSTPAEVERLITRPIEEALATISAVKQLRSTSSETGAQIQLEFDWEENINAKSIEVREKVDAIRHLLPKDVQRVLVYQFNTNDMPIFQLRISSQRDLSLAYDLLERHLKRPIERVTGVSKVELYGVNKRQISIRLNADKVAALHINTRELAQTLNQYNFSMTAGHIFDDGKKILVNPVGEYQSIDEIGRLIVADNVRLADIANIQYELPKREEGRHLDQTYAVGLQIFKESSANLVDVADRVLTVINNVGDNPQFNGINLYVMDNTAEGVTSSLSDLLSAGLLGALLSIGVLYLFLRHITTTLIVVLSVPISICITLGMMYFFGYSLNILSMMGLLLAVGMLVDNSVVITESIFQEKEHTQDPLIATKVGVNKVSLAVIAGTATTMIVFLPNIVGVKIDITIFLEHVAIAICISLFASLLIAQTLIPLLTSKIKPVTNATTQKNANKVHRFYMKSLSWSQNRPKTTALIAILLLASIAIPMPFVTSDEEQNFDDNRIFMRYYQDQQYTLEEAERVITKMENYLYSNKEAFFIESVYSFYSTSDMQTTILLKEGKLPIKMSELKQKIREGMPKFVRVKPKFGFNDGNGGGVQINLTGNSTDVLLKLADNVIPLLNRIKGLEDVSSETQGQQKELQIHVDRTKTYRLGLTTSEVATAVSTALRGMNLRTFRHGETGEVDIMLNFNEKMQSSVAELNKLPISQLPDGQVITLANVATLKIVPRLTSIQRYNRQTALTIRANLEDLTLEQAQEKIEAVFKLVEFPSGYNYTLDGSFQRQDQAENVMGQNMILAICMIYIVMAALFESLLLPTAVITSLLFSFVGVFWAFFVTGTNMSVMGMIGMLILMGIVVNNGIVLVDRINQLMNDGHDEKSAVIEACDTRLRPIMMTVSTTILGLIPLAMGNTQIGGDGPAYSPMAIAIIGGLAFSTLTSLYLVPFAYVQLLRLRSYSWAIIKQSKQIVNKKIKA